MTYLLLVVSFALLLGGALVFTNAVEWAGYRVGLGEGAVGSIFAAVATALPESIVPVVAIISGIQGSEQVAIGAIIGAPFLLGTLAMALVGAAALGFRGRREQDDRIDAHRPTFTRDLIFFLVFFGLALALGLVGVDWLNYVAAVVFIAAYGVYVWRSIVGGGEVTEEEGLSPLYIDTTKDDPPSNLQLIVQLVAAIAAIGFGAHLFVEEITHIAEQFGIAPLVLALVLAPLATELPEKFNSFIWIRGGKDSLALGNITGAMVFQSTLPVSIGLLFTSWTLANEAVLAAALGLVGGAIALLALRARGKLGVPAMLTHGALFVGFVVVMITISA